MPQDLRTINLRAPVGGVNRRLPYQQQPPYTCVDALNVRPDDVLLERQRIGSRPGLKKAYSTQLGSGNPVNLLASVTYKASGGSLINPLLLAASNGSLYQNAGGPTWASVSTSLAPTADQVLHGVGLLSKIYIADWDVPIEDTDGVTTSNVLTSSGVGDFAAAGANKDDFVVVIVSGSTPGTYTITSISTTQLTINGSVSDDTGVSFRVQRAPKVFNPTDNSVSLLTASAGTAPSNCYLITRYRSRLVLVEYSDPHNWNMSAAGSPLNWDYSVTDPTAAVSGTNSDAGTVGDPITALITHNVNCLLFGCDNSLYICKNDPGAGGRIDPLSNSIGVLSQGAFCYTDDYWLFFLGKDGLYAMPPGCGNTPFSVSREKMPLELRDIDPASYHINMAYDVLARGIHLFITDVAGSEATTHWWIDVRIYGADQSPPASASFSPVGLTTTDHLPFSIHAGERFTSSVLIGCQDGYVRKYDPAQKTDDGMAFSSYVWLGPILLGGQSAREGLIQRMQHTLAADSDAVDVDVYVGDSAEAAYAEGAGTAQYSTTLTIDGLNHNDHPRAGGVAAMLKLSNGTAGEPWAWEGGKLDIRRTGMEHVYG